MEKRLIFELKEGVITIKSEPKSDAFSEIETFGMLHMAEAYFRLKYLNRVQSEWGKKKDAEGR